MAEFFAANQKRRLFGFAAFLPDLRRFFRIAAELVFSVFYPPICGGNRRECGGNRRECGGNSRKANGVAAFLFWLRRFFGFAADFLECGGNFRRNALRQKFPPREVLGISILGLVRTHLTGQSGVPFPHFRAPRWFQEGRPGAGGRPGQRNLEASSAHRWCDLLSGRVCFFGCVGWDLLEANGCGVFFCFIFAGTRFGLGFKGNPEGNN